MATEFVKVNVDTVGGLAEKLSRLTGEVFEKATVTALNTVIDSVYDLGRGRMNSGMDLTDQYLKDRMLVTPAAPGRTKAELSAASRAQGLSHYSPVQLTQTATARAKGSTKRGIPPGQKAGGVAVTVRRGSQKPIKSSKVFLAPSIKDSEGNPFIMRRVGGRTSSGKTKMQRVLGPAVYQLFAHQLPPLAIEAEEMLAEELMKNAEREFLKELT